jgi:hypothetical protein
MILTFLAAQRFALLALGRAWKMFGSRKKVNPENAAQRSRSQKNAAESSAACPEHVEESGARFVRRFI